MSDYEGKISQTRWEYTVDLLTTMAVQEIAREYGVDEKTALEDFLVSETAKALNETDNKLWCNGPDYIADLYKTEQNAKRRN